jgi:hypothetical protein
MQAIRLASNRKYKTISRLLRLVCGCYVTIVIDGLAFLPSWPNVRAGNFRKLRKNTSLSLGEGGKKYEKWNLLGQSAYISYIRERSYSGN